MYIIYGLIFFLGTSFIFLVLCMVTYDDEYNAKENENLTEDKIEPQHLSVLCA